MNWVPSMAPLNWVPFEVGGEPEEARAGQVDAVQMGSGERGVIGSCDEEVGVAVVDGRAVGDGQLVDELERHSAARQQRDRRAACHVGGEVAECALTRFVLVNVVHGALPLTAPICA